MEPTSVTTSRLPGSALALNRPHVCVVFALAAAGVDGRQRTPSARLAQRALDRLGGGLHSDDVAYLQDDSHIVLHLDTRSPLSARRRIHALTRLMIEEPSSPEAHGSLDVVSAWCHAGADTTLDVHKLTEAADRNLHDRDLMPRYISRLPGLRLRNNLLSVQVAVTLAVFYVLPFAVLVVAYRLGADISPLFYWVMVLSLLLTALGQVAEATHAVQPPRPPSTDRPAPPATAVIAAYLPNEANTIVETLHSFLRQDYSGRLQVILAYNTPEVLPVEAELAQLADRHPQLFLLRVADSTSKAQNVNAALPAVTGEFVGIFDADHHPMAGAFERVWQWMASGVDVVQGHCVVRNADASFVAGMVSVEFEQIYAVSHPGRQALHGFGVFGGSNGYWRTSVLRATRLRPTFLTEDIDASIRVIRGGGRIVNDPGLLSRELAPETLSALWRQRLRWAQGWFQVSLRHTHGLLSEPGLTGRQRRGMGMLLAWREAYAWVSAFAPALLAFYLWRDGGISFGSSLLLYTTALTLASGPVLALFAVRLGAPEVRRHRGRALVYVLFSALFYQEMKNFISRLAQVRHFLGERAWVVTPRTAAADQGPDELITTYLPHHDRAERPLVLASSGSAREMR